jgi:hypothetical protein
MFGTRFTRFPMPLPLRLAVLAALLAPMAAHAQSAAPAAEPVFEGLHLVRAWNDVDKGTDAPRRVELYFDYAAGRALQRVYGADGERVLERVLERPLPASRAEKAAALAMVRAAPEVAALETEGITERVEIDGGFVYAPADGPCGPGGRCLQFDVMTADRRTSLRYALVDLRAGRVEVLARPPTGSR